jgi:hypothetical protein
MTRHDTLQCVHEPFGDAYYFGPERLAERYENDPKARKESGYEESTYRTIFDRIARENSEVRLLIFLFVFLQHDTLFGPSHFWSLPFSIPMFFHRTLAPVHFCMFSSISAPLSCASIACVRTPRP